MLDPVIHQQNRLQLMVLLVRHRLMSFTELRDACGLTTGNAGSHLDRLEDAGYVKQGRLLVGLAFEVHYRATDLGIAQFQRYVAELRQLIESGQSGPPDSSVAER